MKELVVDVDGVLCQISDQPYAQREPFPFAAYWMKKLKDAGWWLNVQTARYSVKCDGNVAKAHQMGYQELVDWLIRHNIPFDTASLGKQSGLYYLDDRAVRIESAKGEGDWEKFFSLIEGR